MHLYQLRVINYRRFVDATINLDAKMVAILGPNESGKSSLLLALPLFNDHDRVPTVQLRRDSDQSDSRLVGELTYRLTDEERAEIPYNLPASDALWLVASKRVGGVVRFALYPRPSRPHTARLAAAAALRKAPQSPWWRNIKALEDQDDEDPLTGSLASLAEDLGSDEEQLSDAGRSSLQSAIARLSELDLAPHSKTGRISISTLVAKLESALAIEQLPSPPELATAIAARRPHAIPFNDSHRTLGFTHNLTDPNLVSAAFQNLADFGGLNLSALQAAILQNDSGAKRTLLGNAVTEINRRLEEDWGQSDLKVDFDVVSLEDVRITVAGADGEQFDLTHRSDGMRMFLALCAFLAKEGQDPKPVLLIDELERHLHYEAQADIVSMFDARTDVAQVVYSTHSIGCLPYDRQCRRPHSYGEGPCDALLLPSLIRDAIDETPLDYLIVSGASVVSRANFDEFDHSALRVVYLYDGDQAAKERRRFLHNEKGVPLDRILQLEAGVTLEDLVEPGLWVEACNRAIATIAQGNYAVTDKLKVGDVRQKKRVSALNTWCSQRGYRAPEKLKLAETIIELMTGPEPRADRRWLDPRRRSGLRVVHESIAGKLAKVKNP